MLAILFLGYTHGVQSALAQEKSEVPRAQVRLQAAVGGAVSISLDGRTTTTTETLRQSPEPKVFGNVSFSLTKDQQFLVITSQSKEVVVEAVGFDGWAARLVTNDVLQVRIDPVKRVIDLLTPAGNKEPVSMRFADGAKAVMKAGSTARFDLFDDQSYYLSGQGQVAAANADGLEKELSIQWPPMAGGRLVSTNDSGDKKHLRRITPIIHISIAGALRDAVTNSATSTNQGLTILVDDRRIQLQRGESREVAMPNGSVIDFSYPPDTYRLDWRVRKGFFYITLHEFQCWEAIAITDQRGWYQWDAGSRAIDITNRTLVDTHPPNKFILCTLSRTFTGRGARVTIAPRSMFHYIQILTCETWAGAGDGDVKLYSSLKPTPFDLTKGNLLVRSGLPVGAGTDVPRNAVGLSWDPGKPLGVTSSKGGTVLPPDSEKLVPQGEGGEINVQYTGPGLVTTTAVGGSYTLQPKVLNDWTFDVLQGDGVSFNLDVDHGVFIIQADPNNNSPVHVGAPGRTVPVLEPGTVLTIVLSDPRTVRPNWERGIIFFESAGADTPGAFGTAPVSLPPPDGRGTPVPFGQLVEQPRILEPPASVTGKE